MIVGAGHRTRAIGRGRFLAQKRYIGAIVDPVMSMPDNDHPVTTREWLSACHVILRERRIRAFGQYAHTEILAALQIDPQSRTIRHPIKHSSRVPSSSQCMLHIHRQNMLTLIAHLWTKKSTASPIIRSTAQPNERTLPVALRIRKQQPRGFGRPKFLNEMVPESTNSSEKQSRLSAGGFPRRLQHDRKGMADPRIKSFPSNHPRFGKPFTSPTHLEKGMQCTIPFRQDNHGIRDLRDRARSRNRLRRQPRTIARSGAHQSAPPP